MKIIVPLLAIMVILLSSCGDSSLTRTLPNVSGSSGELLVVTDRALWEGRTGELIREALAPDLRGLPQPEPAFSLIHVTHAGFANIFLVHRNVVFIGTDPEITEAGLTVTRNQWAESQIVLRLTARDTAELSNAIRRFAPELRERINEAERVRLTSWLRESAGKEKEEVISGSNRLEILLPAGYKKDFNRDSILMISAETPMTTQSVIVSYGTPAMDRIGCIDLANMTEKITSAEVRGPDGGSFMVIEKKVPAVCRSFTRDNTQYIEMRGLWTLEGGFMGGPFISYAWIDTVALKTVVVTGFVYAPKSDKRELLRQVEALMYSVRRASD
ncbi:MAG TPA: DUF4837 family protein [Bacteroidales bacterium]|nr:DUF4837 family protein [Bacteroidales bacterium]